MTEAVVSKPMPRETRDAESQPGKGLVDAGTYTSCANSGGASSVGPPRSLGRTIDKMQSIPERRRFWAVSVDEQNLNGLMG